MPRVDSANNDLVCVFCERAGRKHDPEHVFPQWISRLLWPGTVIEHQPGPHYRWPRTIPNRLPTFTAKRIELTNKSVCNNCNHHWMSDLESRVALKMGRMLGGQTVELSAKEQADFALWAVKTMLMYEQTREPGCSSSQPSSTAGSSTTARRHPQPWCAWQRIGVTNWLHSSTPLGFPRVFTTLGGEMPYGKGKTK